MIPRPVLPGPPETRYARSGGVNIAYQVVGRGLLDLVLVPGWVSNVERAWEEPSYARFLERLASFSRLILFDKRGTGLSDRVSEDALPTLEQRMDDVRAVMDAVGSMRAALFGFSEGGGMCVLFAATYPERTEALVTYGIFAARRRSPDYPWAPSTEERERWLAGVEADWGGAVDLATLAPSRAGDERFSRWWARYLRASASPGAAVALGRMNTAVDVRSVLPAIRVPTLVIHRTGDHDVRVEEGRWIASRIPGARFLELPGEDHLPWTSDPDEVPGAIEQFLTGQSAAVHGDRLLATVLFTDIVDSTRRLVSAGDARWRETLESLERAARERTEFHRGRFVKSTGDGFLATFDGPARAIRCAVDLRGDARASGLEIRAGLHTGECEVSAEDVSGLAVHIAARVLAEAEPGEIVVSRTVRDLVAGSGLGLDPLGAHRLAGVPEEWELYRVA